MNSGSTTTIGGKAAGLSAGTGFTGVVLLLPDGLLKSILLIAAPTITIVISGSWALLTMIVQEKIADWRLRSQKQRAAALVRSLASDPTASAQVKGDAQKILEALTLLEVEIAKKRAAAIVTQ